MKKLLSLMTAIALMLTLSACGDKETKNPATSLYKAGTYSVEAQGMQPGLKLDVTFSDDKITEIKVISHSETPGISDAAFEKIPAQIIEHQSLGMDAVAGATFTSKGIIAAVSSAVEQAGGDVEALKAVKIENKVSTETVEKEADVIIVGGGGAGFSSAVSAAEEGLSVIIIEKNSYVGGNTVRSGGAMTIADQEMTGKHDATKGHTQAVEDLLNMKFEDKDLQRLQAHVAKEYAEFEKTHPGKVFDSVAFNTLQLFVRFGQHSDIDQLYCMLSKSAETRDWLGEYGLPWRDQSEPIIGDNWPRWLTSSKHKSGIAFIETLENAIKDNNYDVEVLKQVAGEELVQDESGRVIAVNAKGADGTSYKLTGRKGVVLATGGFAANNDMMVKYSDGRWSDLAHIATTNDPACQGDGINMAVKVGAQLHNMGHIQCLPVADPETGSTGTMIGLGTNLYINNKGERFVNETTDRDTLTNAILAQPNSECYVISSIDNNGLDANGLNLMGTKGQDLLDSGKAIKADTLEELAKKIGVPYDTFKETVDKFNLACEKQEDPEFGRQSFIGDIGNPTVTHELVNGPFYASLRKPAAHISKGGIRITNACQVLDVNNEIIPGLYAAGEVTNDIGPAGIMQAMVNGKIVGKTIANDNK